MPAARGEPSNAGAVVSCADVVGPSAEKSAWPFRTRLGPLPLSRQRVQLLWFALTVLALLPMLIVLTGTWNDWSAFWAAANTVGTPSLMNAQLHGAWQVAHGLPADPWRYPPAFAWLYLPLVPLPIGAAFAVDIVAMLACVVLSGWFVARIYGLETDVAIRFAFAWTPILAAVNMGQNAPLSLVLALWAIDGLRRGSKIEAGVAVGLLMYKPTLGLPLLGFLLLRGRWRSAGVALAVCAAGYVASVAAAAGDWSWPVAWWNGMAPLVAKDLAYNGDKAVSVPAILAQLGTLPWFVPYAVGGVVLLASLRGLLRAPIVEAASAACLVGLVAGPRVWSYEAGMLLPILAWAIAGGLSEPWRTRLVLPGMVLGLTWMISPLTRRSGVAVIAGVCLILWIRRWPPLAVGRHVSVREAAAST